MFGFLFLVVIIVVCVMILKLFQHSILVQVMKFFLRQITTP